MFGKKFPSGKKDFTRTNFQIKVPKVRVVKDGQNLGVMPTFEARKLAQEAGLDLVEVAPQAQPPVCQIIDYGKFKYDKSKKDKDKKSSPNKEKEISFRYVIDEHDLLTKANQAKKFLEKGFRVKLMVKFKARENAHRDQGFVAIKKCIELIGDMAVLDKPPTMEGGTVVARMDLNRQWKAKDEVRGSTTATTDDLGENLPSRISAPVTGSGRPAEANH
jgi:translation initiation factor IF-3